MPLSLKVQLESLATTETLGQLLSAQIVAQELQHIFMNGPLGSGKTTLTRAIIMPLEGAENCEVSSPSFSIINYYPVIPYVQHCDLYRCQNAIPEELLDNLANPNIVTLLEWSQYLPTTAWPTEVLSLIFSLTPRELTLTAHGARTTATLSRLKALLPHATSV